MKATKGGDFKPIPLPKPATVFARCYSVIDIGTVPGFYQGKPQDPQRKIWITWEMPSLKAVFNAEKGEQPFVISMELTASTAEKSNLSKLISQWRNKPFTPEEIDGFDPATMIGKCGFISFIHKTKGKFKGQSFKEVTNENTNLSFNGIMPVPEGVAKMKQINLYYNWDWDLIAEKGFNKEEFEKIPKFIREKMATSDEFKKFSGGYSMTPPADDAAAEEETEKPETVTDVEGDW
jgi:hypothetical protein